MLTLPIQKKWYQMIENDIKLEEYREIKPYYTSRFTNVGLLNPDGTTTKKEITILLRNGYSASSPTIAVKCALRIGTGNPLWGAEPNKNYYVLMIKERICYEE